MVVFLVVGILVGALAAGWSALLYRQVREPRLLAVSILLAGIPILEIAVMSSGAASWIVAWAAFAVSTASGAVVYVLKQIFERAERTERTYRENEERYRKMVELSPDGIAIYNGEHLRYINSAGAAILGSEDYTQIVGRPLRDFLPAESMEALDRLIEQVDRGASPPPLEQEWRQLNGSRVSVEVRLAPVRYRNRTNVLLMIRDLSTRQQAESRLRLLEAAIQQANEAVLLVEAEAAEDHPRRVLYVNDAFSRMTGFASGEALGRSFFDLIGARAGSQPYRQFQQAFDTGESLRIEFLNRHRNGATGWVECDLTPIFDEQRLAHWVCIQRDISKRRQAEAQVRAQAALLQEAQDAIYVRDLDGYILYWNKSAERLYGWNASEAIDQDVDGLLFRNGEPHLREAQETTRIDGEWTGELHPVSRSGKQLTVSSRWTLVPGAAGKSKNILVVNTDITDKKRLESQLLRAQRLESIGRLASGIAHDLNNVLNPIMMACGLLSGEPMDEESQDLVRTIEMSAQRGTDILKQVLTFARGATGEKRVLQPRDIIRDLEHLIRETFPRNITIQVDTRDDLWTIEGSRTHLDQVLMNLCVNARDAMPGGGVLTITADNRTVSESYASQFIDAAPGPYVVITVSDNGEGIPPDVLDKIFEPFYTTKQHGEGTGLGLATVHSIVKGQGGFINVHSTVGDGTTFLIFLPTSEPEAPVRPRSSVEKVRPGRDELILLVDDEDDIRSLGKKMLEHHGYRAVTASNGFDAVEIYRRQGDAISAVITDMMMPRMDGLATIRALLEIDPDVKILISSGYVSEQTVIKMAQAGAHVFLPKPYNARQMLLALQRLLDMEDAVVAA